MSQKAIWDFNRMAQAPEQERSCNIGGFHFIPFIAKLGFSSIGMDPSQQRHTEREREREQKTRHLILFLVSNLSMTQSLCVYLKMVHYRFIDYIVHVY
jgi:hypothetical protein